MSRATVAQVEAQVDAGADPLKPADSLKPGVDKHPGHTPLHFAAQANPDPSVAALFIEFGADLDARSFLADGGTPLHLAAGGWGIRRAELLLLGRNSIGTLGMRIYIKMLHEMEQRGRMAGNNLYVIKYLLKNGANIEARDNRGASPLHRAAAVAANPDVLELLLSHGATLDAKDSRGLTPLHTAALCNMAPEVVQFLLDNGATLDARSVGGKIPLHFAAMNINPEVLSVLINSGSDINARDKKNRTPLHVAADNTIPDLVKFLLDHGADPEMQDGQGRTPLHTSLWSNHNPAVSIFLIEQGANIWTKDAEGNLPMDIAESNSFFFRRWSEEQYKRLIMLLSRA